MTTVKSSEPYLSDAASLAAVYASGLVRSHGFADGNKCTAWVVVRLFLADNGHKPQFEKADAVNVMERVAGVCKTTTSWQGDFQTIKA